MTITTIPTEAAEEVIGYFTRGIIHNGVAYGPDHADVPVVLKSTEAKAYIQRGVFRPGLPDIATFAPPPVPIEDIADPAPNPDDVEIEIIADPPVVKPKPAPRRRGRKRG